MADVSALTHSARRIAGSVAFLALAGCLDVNDNPEGVAVIAIVSGSQQVVKVGGTAAPLVVRAYNASAIALEGINVNWTASAGTVAPTSTTTDDTGSATVTFTPPSSPTNVTVRASAEGLSVTFNIIVEAASG